MHITNLIIENFLTIGSAELQLTNKGLVLIQGENADDPSTKSNGAGKSSIPDALCWALFGETARGVKGDAVVNKTAKRNARVTVKILDGNDTYEITRHRKHKDHRNRLILIKNGADITSGTDKLTQVNVEQVLGSSLDVFRAAIYAGQDAMPDLPGMTDKQLKLLVEESAGVDRLQAAHEIARQKLNEVIKEGEQIVNAIDRLEGIVENDKVNLQGIQDGIDGWEKQRNADIENYKQRAKEHVDKAKAAEAEAQKFDIAAMDDAYSDLEAQIDGVQSEKEQESKLAAELTGAQGKVIKLEADAKNLADQAKRIKNDMQNITDKVGQPCGECGKVYEQGDLENALHVQKQNLVDVTLKLRTIKQKLDTAREASVSTSERLTSFRASMIDVSGAVRAQREIDSERARLNQLMQERDTNSADAKRWVEKAKQEKALPNPFEAQLEDAKRRISDNEDKIAKLKVKLGDHEDRVQTAKDVAEVFSPAGVRAHILDTVTPFLNDRTAEYLGQLSDGNISAIWSTVGMTSKGELREKFNIDVTNDKGAQSFVGLSGGEKRKVRLATAMALQDLVSSRASKPISLFIADEVDDALDTAGLERLMAILDQKARDKGTVLVISHNDLKDWIRETATVTKRGGMSTVSGVLAA